MSFPADMADVLEEWIREREEQRQSAVRQQRDRVESARPGRRFK
jgi:hypothetical protein